MSKQEVILCEELESSLTTAIGNCPHDKLFILTDEHTHRLCLPQLSNIPTLKEANPLLQFHLHLSYNNQHSPVAPCL